TGSKYVRNDRTNGRPSGTGSNYVRNDRTNSRPSGTGGKYVRNDRTNGRPSGTGGKYVRNDRTNGKPSGTGGKYVRNDRTNGKPSGTGGKYVSIDRTTGKPRIVGGKYVSIDRTTGKPRITGGKYVSDGNKNRYFTKTGSTNGGRKNIDTLSKGRNRPNYANGKSGKKQMIGKETRLSSSNREGKKSREQSSKFAQHHADRHRDNHPGHRGHRDGDHPHRIYGGGLATVIMAGIEQILDAATCDAIGVPSGCYSDSNVFFPQCGDDYEGNVTLGSTHGILLGTQYECQNEGNSSAPTVQYTRYLRLGNGTNEKVTFSVLYYTCDDQGKWSWTPGELGTNAQPMTFELAPGEAADIQDGDWRINAAKARVWAKSASGKEWNQFKDEDLELVTETDDAGQHSYMSSELQTANYTVR
ncbi:MAG: hypothetical protein WCJ35_25320, partial [Planctomycetota bacterium]